MCTFRYNGHDGFYDTFVVLSTITEIIFTIDLLANFFRSTHSVHEDDHNHKNASFEETYYHYLKGEFVWDLVPLIPLQLIYLERDRNRIFYVIKMVRIRKAYKLFGKEFVMKYAKKL